MNNNSRNNPDMQVHFRTGIKAAGKPGTGRLTANNKGENGHADTIGGTVRHRPLLRAAVRELEYSYLVPIKSPSISPVGRRKIS